MLRGLRPVELVDIERKRIALELLGDVRRVDDQLEALAKRIAAAVVASGTTVTDVYGIGPIGAAIIVGHTAEVARFPSDFAFPFPGDVLTEIGAAALAVANASPTTPLSLRDATERHLPEWNVSGNAARQKHRAAIQAAVALHAGIVVDYDEVAGWWRVQDLTLHAFEAAVVLIRVAAQHTQQPARLICEEIATRRGVSLDDRSDQDEPLQ